MTPDSTATIWESIQNIKTQDVESFAAALITGLIIVLVVLLLTALGLFWWVRKP